MNDDQFPPNSWQETEDPPRFWVRYQGQILVFPIVNGLVDIESHTTMSVEVFREALRREYGPGVFIDKDMKIREDK